jgi:transposase
MMPKSLFLEELNMDNYDFVKLSHIEKNPRTRVRLLGLEHFKESRSIPKVAEIIKVCTDTVRNWLKNFSVDGLDGLYDKPRKGAKPKLPEDKEKAFKEHLLKLVKERKGGRIKGKEIKDLLAEHYSAEYTLDGVYKLLQRLNLVWISGRSIHPKANIEEQKIFKENFVDRVKEEIPEHIKLKNVDIWFQDEARVGQQGTVTRIWAEKGTRPRVVQQQQFENAYIFGAVCPEQDKAIGLVLPAANTDAMNLHLKEISKTIQEGHHAVIVADKASWHTTDKLDCPSNITLLPLPPYSPELNPVEQIWQQLRENSLSNRCFQNYDEIVDACCEAWKDFTSIAGKIKNLCSRKWACLGT